MKKSSTFFAASTLFCWCLAAAPLALAADNDGDGFDSSAGDCDDTNPAIHPGAVEIVGSQIDENCDGAETCYRDDDNDGYRTELTVNSLDLECTDSGEATSTTPSGDCDDSNATIHPGAVEVVGSGVDEDCDGDEACYSDIDNDGYRTEITISSLDLDCTDSGEAVGSDPGGDCDDGNAAINPGAAEVCDDTADNDCDGAIDCADSSCAIIEACSATTTTLVTQVFDHLECFKIKTTEKLAGVVTLDPGSDPTFALAPGCTISKAKKYCVPVMKTVTSVETSLTPDPDFEGETQVDDRICYKLKCPAADSPVITVQDQFGTRSFEKFKATELCTPARRVP